MKKYFYFLLPLLFIMHNGITGQTVIHSTIEQIRVIGIINLEAQIVSTPTGSLTTGSTVPSTNIAVSQSITPITNNIISKAVITLKNVSDITQIYLKIIETGSNSVVYQVNYTLNSGDVMGSDGLKLFSKDGNEIQIVSPTLIDSKPHTYEIYTIDDQNATSEIFTTIQ